MSAIPTTGHGRVVVGVDFSKDNAAAVEYAAAAAKRRGVPLELLYALDLQSAPQTYLAMTMHELKVQSEGELAAEANSLRADHPGLDVTTRFHAQSPANALIDASEHASMVVLGSRGHGGFGRLLVGSVAWRVASRAHGAVLLVRPGELLGRVASGPVLVGVDGSASAQRALQFAFQEATSRGTGLIAVNVWALPAPDGLSSGRQWPPDVANWEHEIEQDANRILSEMLAGTGEQYPDVAVSRVVVRGLNIGQMLLEVASARDADLIVVGASGRNPLAEWVLGAVGVQLSHHSDRTVAVVRGPAG